MYMYKKLIKCICINICKYIYIYIYVYIYIYITTNVFTYVFGYWTQDITWNIRVCFSRRDSRIRKMMLEGLKTWRCAVGGAARRLLRIWWSSAPSSGCSSNMLGVQTLSSKCLNLARFNVKRKWNTCHIYIYKRNI